MKLTTSCTGNPLCLYKPLTRLLSYILLLIFFNTTAQAQQTQNQITGTVIDARTNQPVIGATVKLKGVNLATHTDEDGRFTLPSDRREGVLEVSHLGYQAKELPLNGTENPIIIALEPNESILQEVEINAGYYTTTDKFRTSNIGRVTASEIDKQPVSNPLLALHGRIPGVVITQQSGVPGNAVKIQIRGQNSLREDANAPLYVIDGVPIGADPIFDRLNGLLTIHGMDPLNTLDPNSIASIEVLKDADATAIYGSRGANGVVLITTKQGKPGKPRLDVSLSTGTSQVDKLEMLDTEPYLAMRREAFANDGKEPTTINAPDLLVWEQQRYTDWQKVMLGNSAPFYNGQLALSGGQGGTRYRITGGRRVENMVFPGAMSHRLTQAGLNLNQQAFNDRLQVSLALNYGSSRNKTSPHDLVSEALRLAPNAPEPYAEDGRLNWENGTWENPFAALERVHIFASKSFNAHTSVQYAVADFLSLKVNAGYSDVRTELDQKTLITSFSPAFIGAAGNAMSGSDIRGGWILEPQILSTFETGNLKVDALLGTTFQQDDGSTFRLSSSGYINDALIGNVLAAGNVRVSQDDERQYRYAAIFSRIGLNWADRYLINLTGRRDGSSRFGKNRKFGNFGALGGAWIISNERFVQEWKTPLSFLKLRGSYGTAGNDQIGDYGYLDLYDVQSYRGQVSLVPAQLYNPDFSWEVNRKLDVELETRWFSDRLGFSVNWFRNISSNQLVGYALPVITGFPNVQANLPATIENKGWEFALRLEGDTRSKVYWSTSVNLSIPRNKLLKYPDIETSSYANTYIVGKSLSVRRLYAYEGLDEDGLYQLADINGDGRYDVQDRYILQEAGRQAYGGLQQELRYRNISLSLMLEYVKQRGTGSLGLTGVYPGGRSNQPVEVLDRWQKAGDPTTIQRYTSSSAQNTNFNNTRSSNLNFGAASFLRLRNIQLAYRLDALGEKIAQGIRGEVFIQGQNLLTLTRYAGWNVEQLGSSYLPPLRTLSLGIRVSL